VVGVGLVFDSVDLKTQFNFVASKISGRGMPPIEAETISFPRVPGETVLYQKWKPRKIDISGYVYDTTPEGALEKAEGLLRLFSSAYSADKALIFPDNSKGIYVRLSNGETASYTPVTAPFYSYVYEIQASFIAYNPFFFDGTTTPPYVPQNLLFHGDFELDSDSDGLANGWLKDNYSRAFLKDAYLGAYSQRLYLNNTGAETRNIKLYQEGVPVYPGTTLFIAAYLKKATGHTSVNTPYLKLIIDESTSYTTVAVATFSFTRFMLKQEIPATCSNVDIEIGLNVEAGKVGTFQADAACVYDLLPLGLQNLTTAQLDPLLPYTDIEG
jgi:hypothetical protein